MASAESMSWPMLTAVAQVSPLSRLHSSIDSAAASRAIDPPSPVPVNADTPTSSSSSSDAQVCPPSEERTMVPSIEAISRVRSRSKASEKHTTGGKWADRFSLEGAQVSPVAER